MVIVFSFIFLLGGSAVAAATLSLPHAIQFEGLTFYTPLSMPHLPVMQTSVFTLTFGEIASIQKISVTNKKEILAETILPTIATTLPQQKKSPLATPATVAKQTKVTIKNSPTPSPTLPPPTTQPIKYSSWGLNADKLFDMSNNYRASKGLSAFQKDDTTCQLASSRAPEINAEIAEGRMHSGLQARKLPYWNSENIISYHSEEAAFNWWINDTIHREQIEGNYTYSCVACAGNACAQEFTNYQPK